MAGPDLALIILLACGAQGTTLEVEEIRPCRVDDAGSAADSGPVEATTDEPHPAEPKPRTVFYSVTLGAGFNRNYPDGEFFRFSAWKPGKHAISLDIGEQHAGDDSSIGFGATYSRNLDPVTSLSLGAGGGTEPFAPRVVVGASLSRPFFGLGFTVGASYRDWRHDNYATEAGLAVQRWFAHWIVGGGAAYSQGEPASFTGWRGNVGLTYYVWKKTYASVAVDFGQVRHRDWQYDTRSKGLNFGFSQWFGGSSAISLSAGRSLDIDVYGFSVSWLKEW